MAVETKVRKKVTEARVLLQKKIAGEKSLKLGEIVFLVAGIIVILYGHRVKYISKWKLPLGLLIIFAGLWEY